jgi:peptidoglycan/xylan/chitin deacetylase (PgdA/CDA1 family)
MSRGEPTLVDRGRRGVKRAIERVLTSRSGLASLAAFASGRTVVLAYHNVLPDDETVTGEGPTHLALSRFRSQLDLLEEHCDIVPLDEMLRPPPRPGGRLRAVITFDDAYTGTLRTAVPELERRGWPATIFVPTGFIGGPGFWWDRLRLSGWSGERTPLEELRGEDARILEWARARKLEVRPQGPSQLPATEDLLALAGWTGLVRFGVHTRGHPNLRALAPDEVEVELVQCRNWLQDRALPVSNWVAYPYGLTSNEVENVVRRTGFEGGLTIAGRWVPKPVTNPFRVPRAIFPAGISDRNFLLRVYGVVPG